ncbi:MAG: GIY-YIG nuclease family protein [Alphaproteobacteria bacterium]
MFYVYIVANRRNGTIYIGMTDNLHQRIEQHRQGRFDGFTKRHGIHTLVWFEVYGSREDAFRRERQMKEWQRKWKLRAIEAGNPQWNDLYDRINDEITHRIGGELKRITDPPLKGPEAWVQGLDGEPADP